jgi:drug/metabolite transporter (DMT)-like permease
VVVLLALIGSLVVGFSDYAGATASRTRSSMSVAIWMQPTNAILLLVVATVAGAGALHPADQLLGLLGGLGGGLGYLIFLHAMAHGRMSVVAPLAAITTAVVPVVADAVGGVHLRGLAWLGILLALASIPLLTYRPDDGTTTTLPMVRQVLLSVACGACFAVFFLSIGHTDEHSGQWPIAMAGVGGTVVAVAACIGAGVGPGRPSRLGILSGVLMVGSGLAIGRALQLGPVSVATVLGSLYPLVTTACAVHFDHERLRQANVAGVALAVGGAAVLAAAH